MRSKDIDMIVVHGTWTKPFMKVDVEVVRKWHTDKGWSDIGYHWLITRNGTIQPGRKEDRQGAHAVMVNKHSLGVALAGGMDEYGHDDANYTFEQYHSLDVLLRDMIGRHPTIKRVVSHRDVDRKGKTCPCFDAAAFYPMEVDDDHKAA